MKKRLFIRILTAVLLSAFLCLEDAMSGAAAAPEESAEAGIAYYVLNPNGAIIYDAPGKDANRIERLRAGEIVYAAPDPILHEESGEAMLRLADDRFVAFRDVREWVTEYYDHGELALVTADDTPVYKEPGNEAKTLGTLGAKAVVTYWGVNRGFLQIYYHGRTGWIDEKCTNRGKTYENRKAQLFDEAFLNAPAVAFYGTADGAPEAGAGTPVYLYPEEDPAFLFGYLDGGVYAVQGTVSEAFYKIEHRGEAVFVPIRFQKSERKTVGELSVNEWAGAPLSGSVMDRFYETTEEDVRVFSFRDPSKVIATLKKGALVQGSADSDAGLKTIMNPIDEGDPYALVSTAFLKPVRPADLETPFEDDSSVPATETKHAGGASGDPGNDAVSPAGESSGFAGGHWFFMAGAAVLILFIAFLAVVRIRKKNEGVKRSGEAKPGGAASANGEGRPIIESGEDAEDRRKESDENEEV